MRIDGRAIAQSLLTRLTHEVSDLKRKGITPTLAVILVGADPGSVSFVRQKQKTGQAIGGRIVVSRQSSPISNAHLQALIDGFNNDAHVHGIIVQRPVPNTTRETATIFNSINPQKDVDGFVPRSPFDVPVAAAVFAILNHVGWNRNQSIVVMGRGETGGKPIAEALTAAGHHPSVVHSQTAHPETIIKQADIVISCVGKPHVITADSIKPGAILVSVGVWRDSDGKLHGDYEEDDIKDVASWYTPTPGGVGPVNVACLMQNLLKACILQGGGIS